LRRVPTAGKRAPLGEFACRTAPKVCRAARTPNATGRAGPGAPAGAYFSPRSACRQNRGTSVPTESPPSPAEVVSAFAPKAEFRGVRHLSRGPTRLRSGDPTLPSHATSAEPRAPRVPVHGDAPPRRPTELRFRPTSVPVRPTSIGNVRQTNPPRLGGRGPAALSRGVTAQPNVARFGRRASSAEERWGAAPMSPWEERWR
jgi:hypothetical protein